MTKDVASTTTAVHFRFNESQLPPHSVSAVTAGDVVGPEVVQATDAAGEAQIDGLVARRRAQLARLTLAARTAGQRREQAEAMLAAQPTVGVDGGPGDLLGVVDAMLEKAVRASAVALEAARGEAAFIVASATSESAEELRRVGLDASALAPVRSTPRPAVSVTLPPSAAELWHRAREQASPPAPAPATVDRTTPETGPRFQSAVLATAMPDRRPAPARTDATTPVVTLVLDPPVRELEVDLRDIDLDGAGFDDPEADGAAHQFDVFWREADGERRVRDRLRRRSPKEDS